MNVTLEILNYFQMTITSVSKVKLYWKIQILCKIGRSYRIFKSLLYFFYEYDLQSALFKKNKVTYFTIECLFMFYSESIWQWIRKIVLFYYKLYIDEGFSRFTIRTVSAKHPVYRNHNRCVREIKTDTFFPITYKLNLLFFFILKFYIISKLDVSELHDDIITKNITNKKYISEKKYKF